MLLLLNKKAKSLISGAIESDSPLSYIFARIIVKAPQLFPFFSIQ